MEPDILYHHRCSVAGLIVKQLASPINKDNVSPSSLPLLAIQFHLVTDELYWYRPVTHDPAQFQGHRSHLKSLRDLKLDPSVYMSYDMFYSVMLANLQNWGQEFDRNYRQVVIHYMIGKVRELVDDESNKSRQILRVFVGISLAVDLYLDERALLEESPSRFNGMIPARKSSIMELPERMEIDEDQCMDDDCVICFEEIGKERKILCMPCSHMFHGECITAWLEKSHRCPVCRYEMPTADELDS